MDIIHGIKLDIEIKLIVSKKCTSNGEFLNGNFKVPYLPKYYGGTCI